MDFFSWQKTFPLVLFMVQEEIRLNSTYSFILKIPNQQEVQKIALNHLPDIVFRGFLNLY